MSSALLALGQILLIDLTLAGDNAVVVGMAARSLPERQRRGVILGGLGLAVTLRIVLTLIARQLLGVIGLTLSGGLLLLWVAWKLYRDIGTGSGGGEIAAASSRMKALTRIAIADISMSLDNVLAVAGAAVGRPFWVLAFGMGLAVIFMVFASELLAKLLTRFPLLVYLGLAIVVFVAGRMIWLGGGEVITAAWRR